MNTTTNFSVPTIGNFTDKLNAVWVEMRDAVKDAIKSYGRETVNEIVEDSRFIVLNGDKVEFQGTADDIATEVDSILAKLHEIKGWHYYEVDFFRTMPKNGKRPVPYGEDTLPGEEVADADYSILIRAWHKPTIEEAEKWLKADMEKFHEAGVLQVVGPVTRQEIEGCYDMSNEAFCRIHGREDEAPVETPAPKEDAPKPAPVESAAAKYYHTNLTPDSVRTASVDEIRKFMDDNWDDISSGINEIIYSKEFLDRVVRPMVRDMLEDFDKNQFQDPFAQANEV